VIFFTFLEPTISNSVAIFSFHRVTTLDLVWWDNHFKALTIKCHCRCKIWCVLCFSAFVFLSAEVLTVTDDNSIRLWRLMHAHCDHLERAQDKTQLQWLIPRPLPERPQILMPVMAHGLQLRTVLGKNFNMAHESWLMCFGVGGFGLLVRCVLDHWAIGEMYVTYSKCYGLYGLGHYHWYTFGVLLQ